MRIKLQNKAFNIFYVTVRQENIFIYKQHFKSGWNCYLQALKIQVVFEFKKIIKRIIRDHFTKGWGSEYL